MIDLIPLILRGVAIAFVLILVLAVGHSIYVSMDSQNAVSQLTSLASGVNDVFSSQPDFTGLSCSSGSSCSILGSSVPSSLMSGTSLGDDPWGGAITITAVNLPTGGSNSGFTIEYDDVPTTACEKVGDDLTGYVELTIGSTTFTPDSASEATPATVVTACQGASAENITAMYSKG